MRWCDEQRRLHTRELAVLRVLDERGQVDPTLDADGESARTVRDKLETARALESLPEIAAAAYEGALSPEQLSSVTKFADEDSDAEWARRAPNVAPAELARLARNAVKPSTEDSRERYEARSLRMWWTPDKGMLQLHGQLPDVMGATFEATVQQLTEQMKPAKGQAWDSFEHRAADALVSLCEQPATAGRDAVVGVPAGGAAARAPARPGGDRRDPDRRLVARAVAGQRAASNRCWSTTTVSRSRSGSASPCCHPRSCGRCCSATGRAGTATVRSAPGSRSTTSGPAAGVAPTTSSNLAAVCSAPPSAARPPRPLGPGRQPQPARRTPTRHAQRADRRAAPATRPATTESRTDGGMNASGDDAADLEVDDGVPVEPEVGEDRVAVLVELGRPLRHRPAPRRTAPARATSWNGMPSAVSQSCT